MTDHGNPPFEVGERYENRKGPFEVISIVRESLRIRWDNGAEVTTTIEDQARILKNMEREMLPLPPKQGKKCRIPEWFGGSFQGLREEDFSGDVTGSHWRSREQFGGAVTRGVAVNEPFNSWAIYKRPEVHWTTVRRRCEEPQSATPHDENTPMDTPAKLQAKFCAKADQAQLIFGLYLERPDNPRATIRLCD